MTVGELKEALAGVPDELMVVTHGYEGGLTANVVGPRRLRVTHNPGGEYCGELTESILPERREALLIGRAGMDGE